RRGRGGYFPADDLWQKYPWKDMLPPGSPLYLPPRPTLAGFGILVVHELDALIGKLRADGVGFREVLFADQGQAAVNLKPNPRLFLLRCLLTRKKGGELKT